jgi:mono/diheme cytochrome c family protein
MKPAVVLLMGWLLIGCAGTPVQVEEGKIVYEQYCASCHGLNGEGQANWQYPSEDGFLPAPPHTDNGHTWHHPDTQLLMVIANGRNKMPAFQETLTAAQQEAVLAYIKTFWSPEIQAAQADVTRQSE